jgi:hypothetical protein
MNIVLSFIGGCMRDAVIAGANEAKAPDGHLSPATHDYSLARKAEIGCQIPVSIPKRRRNLPGRKATREQRCRADSGGSRSE